MSHLSPLLTEARDLTSEQLGALRGWLLDPASWYHAKKRCLPSSTAQFRISGDSGEVRVLVSMNCAGWIVTAPHQYTGAFFDPVRDQVRGLLKALYPEFASPSRGSMWRSGTLSRLRTALAPDPAAE